MRRIAVALSFAACSRHPDASSVVRRRSRKPILRNRSRSSCPRRPAGRSISSAVPSRRKCPPALKQPVVVEARAGAGGNIAADSVSKSPPDGYTLLLLLSTTLTVNPHLYKDLSFNLKPITVVNYSTQTLFVHPSVPVKNLAEFVAWAKKEGPVTYGHARQRHAVASGDGILPAARRLPDCAGAVSRRCRR